MSISLAADAAATAAQPDQRLQQAREFNREAERCLSSAPEHARFLISEAEDAARSLGANSELAISKSLSSRLLFGEMKFDEALAVANEAALLAEVDSDPSIRAQTLSGLGSMWASIGMGEHALPHLEAAAELLLGTDDEAGLALVRSLLGGVQTQLGRADEGLKQLECALASFVELGLTGRAIETRHNIACLHNHEGRFEEALRLTEINAVDAEIAQDVMLLGHIEATAIEALCGLQRFDDAVLRAQSALQKARAGTRGELEVRLWRGIALANAGMTAEALNALEETRQKADGAKLPANPELLSALAKVYRQAGMSGEASNFEALMLHQAESHHEQLTRLRLRALAMTVELQSTRLQFGRVAAERTRLQSQLENNERLLDAANAPDRERRAAFLPELGIVLDQFDAAFDGVACGFSLMYQPVVELRSGAITGFEALLRLRHPKHGDILPLEFIGRLEASGEIMSVGHWVLRQACRDLVTLQRDHTRPLRMAVNVSPREFERAGFAEDVVRVISAANLPTSAVELELTEGVAMSMQAPVIRQLQYLRDAGVRLAMDDFGTGFSNFASMSEAPLSRIKIDRSMISSIGRGERQAAVLRSMVQTARNLGLPLIAEGIEGAHQLAELRALGCEEGQGFMFGAAMPLEAAQIRLQRE